MTIKVTASQRAMRGTELSQPRCCALQGDIGLSVSCGIYPLRASPCREFAPSWENNLHNPRCDRARIAWGLQPLSPGDWHDEPRVA